MLNNTIRELSNASSSPIVDMNASWTSDSYSLGVNMHLGIHLAWSDASITGTLYVDYSGFDTDDGGGVITNWVNKASIALDGTFTDYMFLDKDLPIGSFRLRYVRSAGTATLKTRIIRKGK